MRQSSGNKTPFARKRWLAAWQEPPFSANCANWLLSRYENVKLFGGWRKIASRKMECGILASGPHFRDGSAKRPGRVLGSRSEPQQEVRAVPINRRTDLVPSGSGRGADGERPPAMPISKDDSLALRRASLRRSQPVKGLPSRTKMVA